MILIFRAISFVLLIVFSTSRVFAGWVIMEKTTDSFGNKSVKTTFIQNNKIRFEGATSIAILNLQNKRLTMIFPQYRTYWEGAAEAFRNNTLKAYDAQMKIMITNAPKQDKEIYQKLYKEIKKQLKDTIVADSLLPVVHIDKTGKHDSIIGYPVDEYRVIVNDSTKEYIWVTHKVSPYNEVDFQKMVDFSNSLNPFDRKSRITQSKAYADLIVNGMVLKSVESHKAYKVVTQVTQVRKVDFNDDIFNPPVDYRKTSVMEIMQMNPVGDNLFPENKNSDEDSQDEGFPNLK